VLRYTPRAIFDKWPRKAKFVILFLPNWALLPGSQNFRKDYMSDKAAQLLDAEVLRKFFGDLNTVALDGNFDRKALSARRED